MNKKINPKNILRKISGLPTDEQFLKSLREQLADYMKNTPPLIKIKNPEKLFGAKSFSFKMPAVLGLIVILLSGGATALASQKSLPGETLYPVKLLTENIRLAATLNSETKIESRIALAKKRIEEIQTVISTVQPEQATEKQTLALESALDNFNSQLETILSNTQKFKNKGDTDEAYEVATGLKISMDNYRKLIKEPQNKQEIKFEEDVISSINNFEGKIKIEFDDIDNLEKENMKVKGDKNSGEDKINAAENAIKAVEKIINEREKNLDEQTILLAKNKLIEAKNLLDGAKTDYQNGNYKKAFDSAKKAVKTASIANLLIKVFPEAELYEIEKDENHNDDDFNDDEEDIQANILKTINFPKNNGKNNGKKNNDEND